jgi:hypothetical protein
MLPSRLAEIRRRAIVARERMHLFYSEIAKRSCSGVARPAFKRSTIEKWSCGDTSIAAADP